MRTVWVAYWTANNEGGALISVHQTKEGAMLAAEKSWGREVPADEWHWLEAEKEWVFKWEYYVREETIKD